MSCHYLSKRRSKHSRKIPTDLCILHWREVRQKFKEETKKREISEENIKDLTKPGNGSIFFLNISFKSYVNMLSGNNSSY